ncbi:MAG: fibronectin type III domain-containing protein [Treponemataceae bacterium]|nr:fibronectin type III domain-containing protein [Treponemataceae bacterium]
MKRFFAILLSAAMLISVALFVSCGDNGSQESGGGGDNYYTGGNNGGSSSGSGSDTSSGNTSSNENDSESGSSGTTTTTLSAPTGVVAIAASSSSVKLSWNFVSGATKYKVYNATYSSSTYASFACSTTSTSTTVTGLKANTKYYFWIKADNGTTTSDYSLSDSATTWATSSSGSSSGSGSSGTTTTKLSAPTGLTATAASSSSIKLSWNSVSGATEYQIYCSEYSYTSSASLLGSRTLTSITITGLEANTKYYFWVKATNGTTTSDYSSYDYATTKVAGGTLTVINNSSYAVKNVQMYTTYNASLSGVLLGLDVVISPGYSQTFQNIAPGTYVRLGSETYRSHKISTYKTVVIQSGTTTTLIITDSDIISN